MHLHILVIPTRIKTKTKKYISFIAYIHVGLLTDKRNAAVKSCGSQTQAAQAYHDQNLVSGFGVILICRFCLPGMLANIHVHMF